MKNFILLCLLSFSFQLQAQVLTNYTIADGLINNDVHCLDVDANDHLWFGTQQGISFFDGTNWTNYNTASHPDLVDNGIKAIAVDSENNIWIGTDFGLNKFDGTTWTTYLESDGLADNRIKYIRQGPDGNIWVANNDGISIFDGTNWTSYTMADGLPFGGTNYVTFDNNEKAYLGTPLGGIWILDGSTWSSITENDGLLSNNIRSLEIDGAQRKWIGTADGISVFNANNEFVQHHELIFELPPPDSLNPVEDIKIASDGRIWAGVYIDYLVTEGGVSFYDSNGWGDIDVNDGLIGPVVRRLVIDSQDIIWVATSTGITKIGETPTAAFEPAIDQKIELFPNPTSQNLNLTVPQDLLNKTYSIYNNLGQLIQKGRIVSTNSKIELSGTSGLYFLTIDDVYTRKIVLVP